MGEYLSHLRNSKEAREAGVYWGRGRVVRGVSEITKGQIIEGLSIPIVTLLFYFFIF